MGHGLGDVQARQLGSHNAHQTFQEMPVNAGGAAAAGQPDAPEIRANQNGQRPPNVMFRMTKIVTNFMNGTIQNVKDRFHAHVSNQTMDKIDIETPKRPEILTSFRHALRHDAFVSESMVTGRVDESTYESQETFLLMFGKEDPERAPALLENVLADKEISGKLMQFLLGYGSFEVVDGAADDHFAYNSETRVIQISKSILDEANSAQLLTLLDENIEIVSFNKTIIGADNIAQHRLELQQAADLAAIAAKPDIDMTRDVPTMVRITNDINFGRKFEVAPEYVNERNMESLSELAHDTRQGHIVPTESQLTYAVMFDSTLVEPGANFLDPILADDELKTAIFSFLLGGGIFSPVLGGDGMTYERDANIIEVPTSLLRGGSAGFENALRALLELPAAPTSAAQVQLVVTPEGPDVAEEAAEVEAVAPPLNANVAGDTAQDEAVAPPLGATVAGETAEDDVAAPPLDANVAEETIADDALLRELGVNNAEATAEDEAFVNLLAINDVESRTKIEADLTAQRGIRMFQDMIDANNRDD